MSGLKLFIDLFLTNDLDKVRKLFKESYLRERHDGLTALHWASLHNNVTVVRYLLSKGSDIEAESTFDCITWVERDRPLHIAAREGHKDVIQELINEGCDINARNIKGQTALDAVKRGGSDECSRLLNSNNTRIKVKVDSKGLKMKGRNLIDKITSFTYSPLIKVKDKVSAKLIIGEQLKKNKVYNIIDFQTRRTFLDELIRTNDKETLDKVMCEALTKQEIDEVLSMDLVAVNQKSLTLLQEFMLYRCILHNVQGGFDKLCTPDIVNKNSLFMGPSALETAVKFKRLFCVKLIIYRLLNVDQSWTKAETIAEKEKLMSISALLTERKLYLKNKDKQGYTRLQVAVFDNEPLLIKYILRNKLLDTDEAEHNVGTALSLAYAQDHMKCVQILQDHQVNVNTLNNLEQNPLQVAIVKRIEDHWRYLVKNTINLETRDLMGFTALELAVMNNCEGICEALLDKGAKWRHRIHVDPLLLETDPGLQMILYNAPYVPLTSKETLFTLCLKINNTIYPCLLERLDQKVSHLTDGDGNSLLHICAECLLPLMCAQMICMIRDINLLNLEGDTPLLHVLKKYKDQDLKEKEDYMVETFNVLLEGGASVKVKDSGGHNVLDLATDFYNERLILSLVNNKEVLDYVTESHWSTWTKKEYFRVVEEALPHLPKSLLQRCITKECLVKLYRTASLSLIKSLYDRAEYSIQSSVVERILYKAATLRNESIFKELINRNISADSVLDHGDSLLSALIKDNNQPYFKMVLSSTNAKELLQKRNAANKLPLHVVIEAECWSMVNEIIFDTKDVDLEDDEGYTPLAILFTKLSTRTEESYVNQIMSYVKILIKASADINKMNKFNRSTISYCSEDHMKAEIESFSRHHFQVITSTTTESTTSSASSSAHQETSSLPVCVICADETINCALNCGHMFCMSCAEKEIYCYICRRDITDRRRLFL